MFRIGFESHLADTMVGVHGKAVGYPTPYDNDLTLKEKLTHVNPTIELMGKVHSFAATNIFSH